MSTEKPPTQYAGVVGIEPKPIVLTPEPAMGIFWPGVAGLPPFQMFICEQRPNPDGRDSKEWALEIATDMQSAMGDEALMAAYVAWHTAKGYWPNETPLGEATCQ